MLLPIAVHAKQVTMIVEVEFVPNVHIAVLFVNPELNALNVLQVQIDILILLETVNV